MAKLLKLRRGTTSQHGSFTGAEGEVTVDTTKDTLVVHDNSTAGGHPVAAEDLANVSSASIVGRLGTGSIVKAKLEADAIDGTKLADDAVNSEHYVDASIDHQHLSNDCIDGDNIQDDVVNSEHIAAGAVDLEHMSSESVDEDNLYISNAGTDGQYLQKNSGTTGGLTWATVSTTAAEATNVTVSANNSTDETVYPTFVDGATGAQGIETDTGFTYNPSTGLLTAVGLTLSGDLTVNGTTTTINSTTLAVDDKNIELGTVDTPSDTTADGGGITLKGASDKTFNWVDSTDAWTSSEHIHVGDDKKLIIGTGSDLQIYHSSNESKIINQTGSIWLQSDTGIRFTDHGLNQSMAAFYDNGACELYHNGTKKIETTAAGVTVSGSVTDDKGNVRSIPQNTQGSTYTLVAADAGKHILASGTITVPDSVFSAGDAVTIVNNTGSDLTITKTITTMYLGTDASSANRTLATRGIATILFASGTVAYISGAGLS